MIIYTINLLLVTFLSSNVKTLTNKLKKNRFSISRSQICLIIICLMFISLYAFRFRVGADFEAYYNGFYNMENASIISLSKNRDWLFDYLVYFDFYFFNKNYILHAIILGILTYVPVMFVFYKLSDNLYLTLYVYICLGLFYFPMNGVRQGIAISFSFLSIYFLYNKKYIFSMMLLISAFLFHSTAIFVLIFYPMLKKSINSKMNIIYYIILFISSIFFSSSWNALLDIFSQLGQTKLVNDYSNVAFDGSGGSNIFRTLVVLFPVILAFFNKKLKFLTKKDNLIFNCSIISLIFMFVSLRGWIFARFAYYFLMFFPLIISNELNIVKEKDKRIFNLIVMVLFYIYMIFFVKNDSMLIPYRFIWNG